MRIPERRTVSTSRRYRRALRAAYQPASVGYRGWSGQRCLDFQPSGMLAGTARLWNGEFVALIEHVADRTELAEIAARLVTAVEIPVALPDGTIDVGASIGIAVARGPDDDPDALMRDADVAMYRAKSLGRGRYEFLEPQHPADPTGNGQVTHGTATNESKRAN